MMQPRINYGGEAGAVLQRYQQVSGKTVTLPIPVQSIAEEVFGYLVIRRSLTCPSLVHVGEHVIEVNVSDPLVRQRFSIAHEIGHIVLHSRDADLLGPPTPGLFGDISRPHITRADSKDWWETQANRFAEALLIPLASLREQLARLKLATQSSYLAPEKRLKAIIPALSEIFDTSVEAMRYRLKNSNAASELFMDRLL